MKYIEDHCKSLRQRAIGKALLKSVFLLSILVFFMGKHHSIYAQAEKSQDDKYVNVAFSNNSFQEVIQSLEGELPVRFYYKKGAFRNKTFSDTLKNVAFENALSELFTDQDIGFIHYAKNQVILYPSSDLKGNTSTIIEKGSNKIVQIGNAFNKGRYDEATISGKVVNQKTGEPVEGASIYTENKLHSTSTNGKGHYKLTLPTKKHKILSSHTRYENDAKTIQLIDDGTLNFSLFESASTMDEVVITDRKPDENVQRAQMSIVELDANDIQSLPSLMGETDVIKSMTLLPGVQSVGEASGGFNIRGGSVDQNLILVEDIPMFNTSHLFGFFSTLQGSMVDNVTLYKGNIPARFGGRASSVMDIDVKSGDMEKFKASGGIGLINTKIKAEVPVVKNKVSLSIGGRTTYSDWILGNLPDLTLRNSEANYYDLIGKLHWKINTHHTLSVFGYHSHDRFDLGQASLYEYGNKMAGIDWSGSLSQDLSFSFVNAYSGYDLQLTTRDFAQDPMARQIKSGIGMYKSELDFNYSPFSSHEIKAGLEANYYTTQPGKASPASEASIVEEQELETEQSLETSAYISDNYSINDRWNVNLGLRYSSYRFLGPKSVYQYRDDVPRSGASLTNTVQYQSGEVVQSYRGLEPRLSVKYSLTGSSSMKAAYNRNRQHIQLISNTAAATPTDIWKLADDFIKPIISDQFSLGYFRNFQDNTYETSLEVYYKQMQNLVDYKNGAVVIMNDKLSADLLNGKGKAYGAEIMVRKNKGKLNGWIGYTYARSFIKSPSPFSEVAINNGNYYPAAYDKPHDITASLNYKFSRRWSMSGNFTYSTGRPVTLPEYSFSADGRDLVYFSERNKYRIPDYHRFDLAITYHGHLKREQRFKTSWTLSVYNLYGRSNPYSVYYTKDQPTAANNYQDYVLYRMAVVDRPIPTLTFNFDF